MLHDPGQHPMSNLVPIGYAVSDNPLTHPL
jgi:hypothetical protein